MALAGSVVGACYLAHSFGFWTRDLTAATILWFLFVGFGWLLGITNAGTDDNFFQRRIVETIGIAAFLEFFVNIKTFPLWVEIPGQLVIITIVLLSVIAQQKEEHRPVAKLMSGLLAIIGLVLFLLTVQYVASNWHSLELHELLNELLLPIWLTLAVVPAIYLVALYAGYELVLKRMKWQNDERWPSPPVLAGLALGLRGSLRDLHDFTGGWTSQAAKVTTTSKTRSLVREMKQQRARDQAERAAARERLVRYAGVVGVDEDGFQLDRREFAETKEALRWYWACSAGWYQNDDRPDTYRSDLIDVLGPLGIRDLPEDHGIVTKVRKDGQAWYAYRVTPSGYVFGIGASKAPPSQWLYAGSKPPSGYPSKKGGWTSELQTDPPEWKPEDRLTT
jgi:hypothetical protein